VCEPAPISFSGDIMSVSKPNSLQQLFVSGFLACSLGLGLASGAMAAPSYMAMPVNAAMTANTAAPAVVNVSLTKAPDTGTMLRRYQAALDQLAAGRLAEARALVEDAQGRFGDSPELNLLLGYLLDREGQTPTARQRLASVSGASPLAAEYASQLSRNIASTAVLSARYPKVTQLGGTATTVRQGDQRLANLEVALVQMVNAERAKAGMRELSIDTTLADTARAHSIEMRDRKYFSHESPTDALRDPLDRYRAVFSSNPRLIAENLYRAWGSPHLLSEKDALEAHNALMKSPGHRANIFIADATRIGIGIVANSQGDLWVTQMFAHSDANPRMLARTMK
jgi:uncharacterized protein YkwD